MFYVRILRILAVESRTSKAGRAYTSIRALVDAPFISPTGTVDPGTKVVYLNAASTICVDPAREHLLAAVSVKDNGRRGWTIFLNGFVG